MTANKKARVAENISGLKAGTEKMFPDPQLPTAETGCPSEFPSEFGEVFGLIDNSFAYTDWLNMNEQIGRSPPSLPVIIEGSSIPQDDFWSDLMPNTPTFSKLKLDDPSCNDRFFDGSLTDSNNDMIALEAGLRMQDKDATFSQKFGIGSSQRLSRESGSILEQFEDSMELMDANDIDLDFLPDAEIIATKSVASSKTDSPPSCPSGSQTPITKQERDKPIKSSGKVLNSLSLLETRADQEQSIQPDAQFLPAPPSSKGSKAAQESRWAEQLLSSCASAIASRNIVRTQHLMWVLNDLASLAGDANQRLAAYGLKALFSRITGSVTAASAYHHRSPPSSLGARALNRALLKLHDVNPWHQLVYTATNGVLLESFEGKNRIHVVDIGISQGTQWPTFLEALATRSSGAPELLRLTIVDDPLGSPFRSTQGGDSALALEFKGRLDLFAKVVGLNMELRVLTLSLEDITMENLELKSDEALGVCAQFCLHRLNESSTDGNDQSPHLSSRDRFLRFLYDLQPQVMILNENDVNHLGVEFLARFQKVVDFQWRFLESMSCSFKGRDCEDRQIIEYELALCMINNIACEGPERIERNDTHSGWALRMRKAGFSPDLPADEIMENVRLLLRKYDSNWEFVVDENCLVLQWKQQPVTFCSIWR